MCDIQHWRFHPQHPHTLFTLWTMTCFHVFPSCLNFTIFFFFFNVFMHWAIIFISIFENKWVLLNVACCLFITTNAACCLFGCVYLIYESKEKKKCVTFEFVFFLLNTFFLLNAPFLVFLTSSSFMFTSKTSNYFSAMLVYDIKICKFFQCHQ